MPAKPSNSRKFPKQTSGPRPGQFKRPSSPQMRAGSASGVKTERNSPLGYMLAFWADLNKKRLAIYAALAVAGTVYWPWIKFQIEGDLRNDVCETATATRTVSAILREGDPITMHDIEALSSIRIIGHHTLARRPIMELPVMHQDLQIQLGEHPSVRRLVTQYETQERLALTVADDLDGISCEAKQPLSPHGIVVRLFASLGPNPDEVAVPAQLRRLDYVRPPEGLQVKLEAAEPGSVGPSLKPDHLKVAEVG